MQEMAHSICLIKLYQITMRKKFRFFVSDYLNTDKLNCHSKLQSPCLNHISQSLSLSFSHCSTMFAYTLMESSLHLKDQTISWLYMGNCQVIIHFGSPGSHKTDFPLPYTRKYCRIHI